MAKTQRLTFRADMKTAAFERGLGKMRKSVASSAAGIAGAFGVAFGGAAIVSGIRNLVKEGDRIGKTAKQFDITAEALQKIEFAAERSGVQMGDLNSGMRRMTKVILDAENGLSTAKRTLQQLGLTLDDVKGKSPDKQLEIIFAALNKVTDSSKKAALAQEAFGRSGTKLVPMAADYKALLAEAEALGNYMSNEAVASAEKFADSMTNLGTSLKSAIANSGLIDWLAEIGAEMDAIASKRVKLEVKKTEKDGGKTRGYYKDYSERGWLEQTALEMGESINNVVFGVVEGTMIETGAVTDKQIAAARGKRKKKREQEATALAAEEKAKSADRGRGAFPDAYKVSEADRKAQKKQQDAWFGEMGGFVSGVEAPRNFLDMAKGMMRGETPALDEAKEKEKERMQTAESKLARERGLGSSPLNSLERIGAGFGKAAGAPETTQKKLLSVQEKAQKSLNEMTVYLDAISTNLGTGALQ